MPKSMTGYGRSMAENDDFTQVWEVKAVNSRYLDMKWRLPPYVRSLEPELEKLVKESVARGRIEIGLHLKVNRPDLLEASFNRPLAQSMLAELSLMAEELEIEYVPDLNRLLSISSLWQEGPFEPDSEFFEELGLGLKEALDDFNQSRRVEGKVLAKDISLRLIRLGEWREQIMERAPDIKEEKLSALAGRIKGLLEKVGSEPCEERVLQEAAILSDKLDISEELTRLGSHLDQMGKLLSSGGEIGKRLDFLLQETFREINTCGNKAQDISVSRIVVDFKAELEKCREQVQNIE